MRMSIMIGLVLVTLGGVTLYQMRNGFLMYLIYITLCIYFIKS